MRFGKSIAGSFILIVLVVLMVGQGALWSWFLFSHRDYTGRTRAESVKSTGGVLAELASPALLEQNYDSLDPYIKGITKDENIISVRVLDKGGNVVKEKASRIEERGKSSNPFFVPWSNHMVLPVK